MIKINYQKKWNNKTGTCYSQTITATRTDFIRINEYLNSKCQEVEEDKNSNKYNYDFYTKCYMKNLAITEKISTMKYTDYYLNLTQLRFLKEIIKDKRLKTYKNTVLRFLYV